MSDAPRFAGGGICWKCHEHEAEIDRLRALLTAAPDDDEREALRQLFYARGVLLPGNRRHSNDLIDAVLRELAAVRARKIGGDDR